MTYLPTFQPTTDQKGFSYFYENLHIWTLGRINISLFGKKSRDKILNRKKSNFKFKNQWYFWKKNKIPIVSRHFFWKHERSEVPRKAACEWVRKACVHNYDAPPLTRGRSPWSLYWGNGDSAKLIMVVRYRRLCKVKHRSEVTETLLS